jgi:hypothetical protein
VVFEKKEEKGDGGGVREEKERGWCARVCIER